MRFRWLPNPFGNDMARGINRYMNAQSYLGLPQLFRRTYGRLKSLGGSGLTVTYNLAQKFFQELFTSLCEIDDYKGLYRHLEHDDPW
ncbi:unnamed protein product [Clavelina lepadiformis]|uniref:Uncharacterized protein n=1 Tax=Clavelina lepadiformis TaxID=159417 RepID=A0ABP0EXF8_CLALP